MKINNETKVGALTAIAITMLILGFNFLKGKSLFKTGNFLIAKYTNTKGIMISNGVLINGYQVGNVYDIENEDENLKSIVVTIKLKSTYNIPSNSIATIKDNALSAPNIEITLGNGKTFLHSGDTIATAESGGLFSGLGNKIAPATKQLTTTLHSLDSLLNNVNSTFDPATKNNLQQTLANVNKATAGLVVSAAALQAMLSEQSGSINQSMQNVNKFTKNLADNNEKVTKMMANLEKTTDNLAKTDVNGTVASLKKSIDNLNSIVEKANSKEGSFGLLLNDKTVYNNLNSTIRSANILMDDIRLHPKRYVNISVFGKKDKSTPLTAPLSSDSAAIK